MLGESPSVSFALGFYPSFFMPRQKENNKLKRPTLFESIRENALYAAEFLLIMVMMFVIAYVFEVIARKHSGDREKIFSTRKIAVIGVFSAIAFVLHILDFPLPFAPEFYKLDFSEIPVLVGAYAFGPAAGVMIELVKIVLKLAIKGTTTAFVGDLANFVVGCSFVLPAAIVYHFRKTRTQAIIACCVGTAAITAFGTMFNAVYLLPAFSALYGTPMETLIAMGTAINPAIKDVFTFVLFAVAPLNLLKGASVSLVTMLVYKKLSPIMKYGVKSRSSRRAS